MEDEERKNNLLKAARISINFSLTLIGTAVLIILLSIIPETSEKAEPTEVFVKETSSEFEVDSTEIKDGIHQPSGLIADTGFHLVLKTCAQCHSLDIVKQNRATEKGWKDMITWMQETQGLWDLGADEEPILAYLGKNYAPTNTGRRKNLENIEWYELSK